MKGAIIFISIDIKFRVKKKVDSKNEYLFLIFVFKLKVNPRLK